MTFKSSTPGFLKNPLFLGHNNFDNHENWSLKGLQSKAQGWENVMIKEEEEEGICKQSLPSSLPPNVFFVGLSDLLLLRVALYEAVSCVSLPPSPLPPI